MKRINVISRIRGALKQFTLGLAVSAAVAFGTGLSANAQITYDFSTGLQGWTQIYPTTGALWDNYGGWWTPPPPLSDGHLGAGWEEANTQMGRSPEFKLDGSGELTFQTHGSKSPLTNVTVTPSTVPEIAIEGGGFCGLALRDVAADTYVLSRGQGEDLYGAFTNLSFTVAELAPYANDGKLYTLDWIDYDKLGGGGWCWLEDVSIPGVLYSHPANDNFVNAIDLPGPTGTQTGTDNIDAYLEVGEPDPLTGATNTVWFKWTCPANGNLTVSTLGSTDLGAGEWDAILGIYDGASVNALTPLGTTPQDTGYQETMIVAVTAGTTYHIQLAGYANAVAANILLNWSFVPAIRAEIDAFGPGATISPVVANAAAIAWTVRFGSDLATLAPTFTLSDGATCTVASIPAVSGETRDFTSPVEYTVTSSDSAITNVYTVTATFSPPPPGGVTGLALWLDASQLTGLSDNATVTTWTDMSGLGNNATTSAGTPIYKTGVLDGLPVVRFNGASGFTTADLSSLFPSAATVFIVTTINNDNAYTLVKANPGVDEWWRYDGNGQSYPGFFRGDRLEGYCPMPNSGSHVFAVSSSESAWEMSIDGASQGVAGANYNAGGALVIGNGSSGAGLNGDIAEVLLYDRVLTPAEADQVGGYLEFKYGLTTSYPSILAVKLDTPVNTQGYLTGTSITASADVGEPNATLTDTVTFHTTPLVPSGATVHTVSASTTSPFTAALGILPAGTYEIYATLVNNDTPPGTATSATNTFTVAAGIPTSTTLISSINPSTYGQNVTFTATVAPPPTGGTVQFYDGASALGSPATVNTGTGVATYSSTTLGAGTHVISANYSGHWLHGASTSAVLTQVVNQAQLTVKALNVLRAPNTANPEPFPYRISGYQNNETLATSGVTGTPTLTTDAVLGSPVGTYDIICALGSLAAANYSFTFVKGTLTVAVLADTFSVNFYVGPNWPYGGLSTDEQKANVLVGPSIPAGFGDWYASGWANIEVPWDPPSPQPTVTLASTGGSSAQFVLQTCRNGWTYNGPRTTLLGDGNGNMMDAHVNSTFDGSEWFDMEVSEIPFAVYDVIFYMGANQAQFGDGTGNIVFNGGAERAFTLKPGAFDGTFTEMVDATTQGNYIVYTGVTGSSFTTRTWGNGFNHIGPFGFQIRESATPQAQIKTFGPGATISPVVANAATIAWTVLYGTDLANLAPTFTLSPGATNTVGGNTVNSGDTVDFSAGPVDYTVTSSDSTIVNVYTVTVSVAPPSSAKDILTCDIGGTNIAVFKYENIYLKVPAGTSVASLPVNYTVSPRASGAPASGTPRDFTTAQTQTYTITAQDGSTKDYTVTVIVDGPPVLIGHWASGAESLTDSSGYTPAGTHDGVAMGANAGLLAWSSDVPVGFTGKSLDLTGDVAVQIDNTATNDSAYRTTFDQGIGTKFTTTFWFKGPVGTLTGTWVGKSGNTPYGWKARPLNGTAPVVNVDFTMRNNTGETGVPSALQTSGVSVNDGAWHHVAEVLDGWNPSFRKVYVDGVLRAQSTGTNNPVNIANLSHLIMGATQGVSPQVPDATIGATGGFFTGQLYDVRIYNGPLTAAEVENVYTRRPTLTGVTGLGAGGFNLRGSMAIAGDLVTMKATSLNPSDWTPIQTNLLPIGPFSITVPQTGARAFYRLMVP